MNLSEGESLFFDLLRSKEEVTVDELVALVGVSRHAVIVRMKYLSAKVAPFGWIIEKTSSVGRGVKATYTMEKKF